VRAGIVRNNTDYAIDEIRWNIIKAMLDESPKLAQRVKEYLCGKARSTN
jgi:hypothetical protein